MYVKVASSNPDAVVQSSTDFFEAEPLGALIQNQPVEMFEKFKDGEYVKVIATIKGKKVEGWVRASVLQDRPLANVPRVTERGAVDDADWRTSDWEFDPDRGMRKDSPQMKAALERLDAFEKFIAEYRGIKNVDYHDADLGPYIGRLKAFAIEGGLAPGRSQ